MELAQYYGGAPSGGAFSGGLMNPMYYGGARTPKTARKNPRSDYGKCMVEEYAKLVNAYKADPLNVVKPQRKGFIAPACAGKSRITDARRKKILEYARAVRQAKKENRYVARAIPEKLQKGLEVYRSRTACDVGGEFMKVADLKRQAKALKIPRYGKMKKAELCAEVNAYLASLRGLEDIQSLPLF
jgi:hypothetical protein